MFELVFLTGARAGQVVPVTKALIAGRSPDCSLEVPDPNASRQHSKFSFDGKSVTVADNGSSNGTFVNDLRLTGPHRLVHDDVVRLGETRIRFQAREQGSGVYDGSASSIFGFKEAEEDLSQSILLSVADMPKRIQSQEVLAARLNAIIKISKALVNIAKLDQVCDGILETLFEVFPQADRGFLMLGQDAAKLEAKAMRQRGKGVTENLHVSTSICRKALETRTAILFDDSKSSDFDQGQSIFSLRIRSAMTIPLLVNEDVLGLLQIDTPDRTRAFSSEDLELAVAVSQQAAIALHNANLLQKVERETATKQNLMRFLPGPLVQQAVDGHIDLALGGRTCHGTVLFSDIIGFTRMSETLHPEQVVAMMNAYFNRMVPCIEQTSGSIDKFMGDAIMAVWGIPFGKEDSAVSAVQAGIAMQNALVGFNSIQAKEGGSHLDMGIGMNSGMVVAGNIGAHNRVEYTVLGDTVNTAQRVEAGAGRSQVLISHNTWTEVNGAAYGIKMPPMRVKNRTEPVVTYSVRGVAVDGEVALHLPVTCGALPAWLIRRLADGTFLLLHPPDIDISAASLVTVATEWMGIELGIPGLEALLPNQAADGLMLRSQIRLADGTLKGLLGPEQIKCELGWERMTRV